MRHGSYERFGFRGAAKNKPNWEEEFQVGSVKFQVNKVPPGALRVFQLQTLHSTLPTRPKAVRAKQDAHDKSRGGMEFAINRYCVCIYAMFHIDKPGREIIL